MANPPGSNLSGFFQEILATTRGYGEELLPGGYLPFGKGPDMDYDPCLLRYEFPKKEPRNAGRQNHDHEEILCNYRIKVVAELAPSFRGSGSSNNRSGK